jgi:hypothetical protein
MGLLVFIILIFVVIIFPEILVLALVIPLIFLEFILRLFGKSFDDYPSLDKIKKFKK